MRKLLLTAAVLVLSALSMQAADSPWAGTWKLDLAKSKFTGETFTWSKTASGMYHYSDGSNWEYDFAIDGKEYPTPGDGMESWTAAGNNAWESVFKRNGKELSRTRHEISSDGKTLTDTSTGTKPDGSAFNDKTVYTRLSGTTGLEGKWKSTKVNISAPNTWVISVPSEGTMRWEIAEYKETVEGKTDGTDLPIQGPTVSEGFTLSIKSLSPNKLTYTVKLKGKPIGISDMSLSPDGKTLTHVGWSPGKESEKTTGVYLKQ